GATALEMGVPTSTVAQQAAEEQLQQLVGSERAKGHKAKGSLRFGDPVEHIRSLVQSEPTDLLVVGTHGSSGISHVLLGSVAETLIREVSCPVLTVGPNLEDRFLHADGLREVLVPTDLSAHSLAVIPYLIAITAEFQSNVHFLHVMPKESQADLRAIAAAQERIEKLCNCYFSPRALTWCGVEFGEAADRILAAAEDHTADLIAMGVRPGGRFISHLRSGVGYRVIANASCPVLTVKHA
ncbi:MAG TPA: universal stress protein, partial [Terriglobales bacterium]|nr:universal stress protein [Terriglobales bacterium]